MKRVNHLTFVWYLNRFIDFFIYVVAHFNLIAPLWGTEMAISVSSQRGSMGQHCKCFCYLFTSSITALELLCKSCRSHDFLLPQQTTWLSAPSADHITFCSLSRSHDFLPVPSADHMTFHALSRLEQLLALLSNDSFFPWHPLHWAVFFATNSDDSIFSLVPTFSIPSICHQSAQILFWILSPLSTFSLLVISSAIRVYISLLPTVPVDI